MPDTSDAQPTLTITHKEAKKLLDKAIRNLEMDVKVQLNLYVVESLTTAIIAEMTSKGLVKDKD